MLRLSQNQSLVFGVSMHTFCTGQPFRLLQVRQALQALMKHRASKSLGDDAGRNRRLHCHAAAACVP